MDDNEMFHFFEKNGKDNKLVKEYIDNLGSNIEHVDLEGWMLIHFICRYSTHEMIKYIIDFGIRLSRGQNII
jgi:hypothetical protein